ncbi:MAG: prepilin-type N-terminal cleavage/methylation domain-containing protein [PVC group bacterium]|nr:prepilin-type N-terminal cleavage/methylation domain-containing protein [PVC group bacterium]
MRSKGFSLVELVLVVLVIAILVSISVPTYFQTVERARAREARATLESMFAAQRSYSAERRTFIDLPQASNPEWLAVGLENPNLNTNRAFDYSLDETGGNAFDATATRRSGYNAGEIIEIDETGAETASTNWTP